MNAAATNIAYPIEQRATHEARLPSGAFARTARELLAGVDDIVFDITRDGLTLFALSEEDLAAPRRLLRDAFGSALRFSAPAVRLRYADGWQQPVMGFRIVAAPADIARIERGLTRRGAAIADIERQARNGVIRGQAPLARLLGYPRALHRHHAGTAHATLWLSHYEPLWSYACETMACYPG